MANSKIANKITNSFKPFFDKYAKINSIGIWVFNYCEDLCIDDEDVYINGKRYSEYLDPKSDANVDAIQIFMTHLKLFTGEEKQELEDTFKSLYDKYSRIVRKSLFLKALDSFDFGQVDSKLFKQYLGKNFPWNAVNNGVFFTIFRDGKIEHKI